jgi:hypothetical protein
MQLADRLKKEVDASDFETLERVLTDLADDPNVKKVYKHLHPEEPERVTEMPVVHSIVTDFAWSCRNSAAAGYGSFFLNVLLKDGGRRTILLTRTFVQNKCVHCTRILRAAAERQRTEMYDGLRGPGSERERTEDPNVRAAEIAGLRRGNQTMGAPSEGFFVCMPCTQARHASHASPPVGSPLPAGFVCA